MNTYFNEVKKNFGFGCMRLPMKDDEVDYTLTSKMVDYFLEQGFCLLYTSPSPRDED